MTVLDACTNFCTALNQTVGPQLTEWICIAAVAGLTWWRTRKVHAAAQAGIAAANEQVSKAKAEARAVTVQLAEIKGSLRPVAYSSIAPTLPPLAPPSSSSSGNWEPVQMPELGGDVPKPRASMADPRFSGDEPLPPPSRVPGGGTRIALDDEIETTPATPSAKRGK